MKSLNIKIALQIFGLKLKEINMSNFQSPEFVGRDSESQIQVTENSNKLPFKDETYITSTVVTYGAIYSIVDDYSVNFSQHSCQ